MNATIIGNFGVRASTRSANFQHAGWWYEYWTGDSLEVMVTTGPVTLNPGEYRIYTDKKLVKPTILSGYEIKENPSVAGSLSVYPNPVSDRLSISIEGGGQGRVLLRDLSGRVLSGQNIGIQEFRDRIELDVSSLRSGIYFIELRTSNQRSVCKFVKQ